MYVDDSYSLTDNQYHGDANLGGFFSNPIASITNAISKPIQVVQSVAQKVATVANKVTPQPLQKFSPVNVIAKQAAGVTSIAAKVSSGVTAIDAKARALALKAAQTQAKTIYAATAASPLGRKLVTPVLDATAIKSPIGRQLIPSISANMVAAQQAADAQNAANAQAAQQQAAVDAQTAQQQAALDTQWQQDQLNFQAQLDAQYAQDQAAQQAAWQANQSQFTSSGGGGGWSDTSQSDPFASPSIYDATTIDTGATVLNPTADMSTAPVEATAAQAAPVSNWWDWWLTPVKPFGKPATATPASTALVAVDNTPVPAWDPYSLSTDNIGDTMQLSNIPSKNNLFPGTFRSSGLGDLTWSDLMSTVSTMYADKTKASIQQSQAAQADAAARIATANAAALEAQKNASKISTPVMLTVAVALAGALYFMRKRQHA